MERITTLKINKDSFDWAIVKIVFWTIVIIGVIGVGGTMYDNSNQRAYCNSLWAQGVSAYLVEGTLDVKCISTHLDLSLERELIHD